MLLTEESLLNTAMDAKNILLDNIKVLQKAKHAYKQAHGLPTENTPCLLLDQEILEFVHRHDPSMSMSDLHGLLHTMSCDGRLKISTVGGVKIKYEDKLYDIPVRKIVEIF